MSAADVIQMAREAGLKLTVSGTGKIKVAGPRGAIERLTPELAANKPAILAELRQADGDTPPKVAPPGAPSWWPMPHPGIVKETPFGSDGVPARYQAAWQALLAQCPPGVTPFVWEGAIYDCATLFGDFGQLLDAYDWRPSDLFEAPHDDSPGGMIWFIKGSPVATIGPTMVQLIDGRIWLRGAR